jgi:dUTP pyrophosphatase
LIYQLQFNYITKMRLLLKIDDKQTSAATDVLKQYYSSYKKKFETDSGLDLVTPSDCVIEGHQTVQINLGVCCAPVSERPHGYYVYPRSSLAKTPLRLANSIGVIDFTYRGPLIATVDNISNDTYVVNAGTKLFQLCAPDLTPVTFELVDILDWTERGYGAYGSTNDR